MIKLIQTVQEKKRKDRNVASVFLDVKKAYDKAWLDAILYALHKNGVKGKNLQITKKMNLNLKAKVITKYGLTRTINIKDSIRQGGVLSVIEYATLIDEIAKELQNARVESPIEDDEILGCLLWMDDVALIQHNLESLQAMMNITNDSFGTSYLAE